MKRSTVIIFGGALLVIALLCLVLFIGLLAGRDGARMDWQPRWDRDRAHWDSPMWDMWEPMHGSRLGALLLGLLGGLGCLILAGALVLGGAWLANSRHRLPPDRGEPAGLEVLRSRYARGEISREEYLARKEDLSRQTSE